MSGRTDAGPGGADAPAAVLGAAPGSPEWKRLRWRACRRGMKELDVLLGRYLDHGWPAAGEHERRAFLALLDLQDPELARLLLARVPPAAADGGAPSQDASARAALIGKLTDGRYARL